MSGGSYDYAYSKVDEFAAILSQRVDAPGCESGGHARRAARRAFVGPVVLLAEQLPDDRCLLVTLSTWRAAYRKTPPELVALWCASPAGNAHITIHNPYAQKETT